MTTLLILRLLSAFILLAFLGGLAWYLHKELQRISDLEDGGKRMYGELLLFSGKEPPMPHPLRVVTSIGRSPTNTIVINNDYASSQHAIVTRRGNQWWLEDLGSSNGTLLNDIPLSEPTVISPGDTITIGDIYFKLQL